MSTMNTSLKEIVKEKYGDGNVNVKWLRSLQLVNQPAMTKDEAASYTDPLPNGKARQFTFVMEAKSVITQPAGGQKLDGPGFYEITGLAWSGRGRVTQVEVSVDGGQNWQKAQLQEPVLSKAVTRYRLAWNWNGSETTIASRCQDETGYWQPTREQLVAARGLVEGPMASTTTTVSSGGRSRKMVRLPMYRLGIVGLVCSILSVVCLLAQSKSKDAHLGRTPTAEELQKSGIAILPDGTGLPIGSGTVAEGQRIYESKCASCHGEKGEGRDPIAPQLAGGVGTLGTKNPIFTVGSYWPHSTSVWDYIHRAMPYYPQPGSLSANDTYAVTAYILYLNGIIYKDAVMNQDTLPKVKMPNRDGFVRDPRPDVRPRSKP